MKRSEVSPLLITALLAVLAVAAVGGWIVMRQVQIHAGAATFQKELAAADAGFERARKAGETVRPPPPSASKGDVGRFTNMLLYTAYKVAYEQQVYERLHARLCSPALTARAVAAPGGLEAGRKAIQTCRAGMVRYRQAYAQALQDMSNATRTMDIGEDLREAATADISRNWWSDIDTLVGVFEDEAAVYDLREAQLTWLAGARGHWRLKDNRFEFDSQPLLDAFMRRETEIGEHQRRIAAVTRTAEKR